MLAQFSKTLVAVAVSSALTLAIGQAQGQQAQPAQTGQGQPAGPQWKDRAEWDLAVNQIPRETDGAKKLALLEQWTQKYPNTDFKVPRMEQYLDAYRLLNQRDKMIETAKSILADDPKNLTAIYWTAIIIPLGSLNPADTAFAAKAARTLAEDLDSLKPASLDTAKWQQTKDSMKFSAVGHRALGYLAMTGKDYVEAEKQLRANLASNPADAEAAYWLGTSILGQKQAERQAEALFYFARAAAYDGPGAIEPARRKGIQDYLTKAYETYHGKDPEGLQQLLATGKANATPPAGFTILSEAEVKENKHQELAKQDPSLALWVKLKDAVVADPAYFESGMKGALIPPETEKPFRATVISATPVRAPKEVVLGIRDANTPEVTLKIMDTALPGPAEPGTVITFRGVATTLQSEPFMMTFEADRKNIEGWPTPKPPARKAPAKKK